jgi:hypothetical protein
VIWRRRGRHGGSLGQARRELLAQMAADAIDARLAGLAQPCAECDRSRELLCDRHRAEVRQADRYRRLSRELGADV